jgi:hypothetical protein
VAWSSFIGVAVMAVLDVLVFPSIYPEILSVNVWGIIALYDTLGRHHAGIYAICTACAVVVFGAITGRPAVTMLVVLSGWWYVLRDQTRQDEDAAQTKATAIEALKGTQRLLNDSGETPSG